MDEKPAEKRTDKIAREASRRLFYHIIYYILLYYIYIIILLFVLLTISIYSHDTCTTLFLSLDISWLILCFDRFYLKVSFP